MLLSINFIQLSNKLSFLFYQHMIVGTNNPNYKDYFIHVASADSSCPPTQDVSKLLLSIHCVVAHLMTWLNLSPPSLSHPFLLSVFLFHRGMYSITNSLLLQIPLLLHLSLALSYLYSSILIPSHLPFLLILIPFPPFFCRCFCRDSFPSLLLLFFLL